MADGVGRLGHLTDVAQDLADLGGQRAALFQKAQLPQPDPGLGPQGVLQLDLHGLLNLDLPTGHLLFGRQRAEPGKALAQLELDAGHRRGLGR